MTVFWRKVGRFLTAHRRRGFPVSTDPKNPTWMLQGDRLELKYGHPDLVVTRSGKVWKDPDGTLNGTVVFGDVRLPLKSGECS